MAKVVAIDYTRSLSVGEVASAAAWPCRRSLLRVRGLIKATRSEGNQRRFSGIVLPIAIIKVAQRFSTPWTRSAPRWASCRQTAN